MKSILVVTETELGSIDVENIVEAVNLEEPPAQHVELMISYDLPEPMFFKVLNSLALFRFNEAVDELTHAEKGPSTLKHEAEEIATQAQKALEAVGYSVSTTLYSGEPYEGIKHLVETTDPSQAVFITRRYPVEDSLNISWTNHARDVLGLPVLHFHTASTRLED